MDKLHEESRKQFEEFVDSNFHYKKDRFLLFRGEYNSQFTRQLWQAWQASRASIVVESITPSDAPSGLIYQIGGAGLSHDEAICEGYSAGFNEAIRSIGLSIKGE